MYINQKCTCWTYVYVFWGEKFEFNLQNCSFYLLPYHNFAPESHFPHCVPFTYLHILLHTFFMVSSFPLNKSHAPIPPLGQSQRCCGMSPWPFGYTIRGGSQPRFVAQDCLVLLVRRKLHCLALLVRHKLHYLGQRWLHCLAGSVSPVT